MSPPVILACIQVFWYLDVGDGHLQQVLAPFYQTTLIEAGCDEAGRGCLAGPVFAAAVILPPDFYHPLLNDSKLISEKKRDILRPIIEQEAVAFAIAKVMPPMIDKINILQASFRAMHGAIKKLEHPPQLLLIDGNRFKPFRKIAHECIIKGDSKYASIAAASILAKTYRDEYMLRLAKKYPEYNWAQNKGYGTLAHREAVKKWGMTGHHRQSFSMG